MIDDNRFNVSVGDGSSLIDACWLFNQT